MSEPCELRVLADRSDDVVAPVLADDAARMGCGGDAAAGMRDERFVRHMICFKFKLGLFKIILNY